MKVILIQTPWSDSSAREFKNISRKYASYAPLGLMYLAAFVEQNGHNADILDLEVSPLPFDELCNTIIRSNADIIGLTTSTPVFPIVQAYAKALKERTGLPIVVGGAHITVLKDKTFTNDFDFAVANEGEYTLLELMNEMQGQKNFSKINGLIYRQNGQILVNPPRTFIADLNLLPFPARHKLEG